MLKKNFILILLGLLSSCDTSKDEINSNDPVYFSIEANVENLSEEDNFVFSWESDDRILFYLETLPEKSYSFNIDKEASYYSSQSAIFSCSNFILPQEECNYFALFSDMQPDYSGGLYSVSLPKDFSQIENNDLVNIREKIFLDASGVFSDKNMSLNFKHRVSIFNINIKNLQDSDLNLQKINFISSNEYFKLLYSTNGVDQIYSDGVSELSVSLGNNGDGLIIPAYSKDSDDNVLRTYMMAMSDDIIKTNSVFHFQAMMTDGSTITSPPILGQEIINKCNSNKWLPGKLYTFNLDLTKWLSLVGVEISEFPNGGDFDVPIITDKK